MMEAMSRAIGSEGTAERAPPRARQLREQDISDDASSIGPSASEVGGSATSRALTARFDERLDQVLSAVSRSSSDVSSLRDSVEGLSNRLRAVEAGVGTGGGNPAQRCGHCGSTTHLRKDCPVRKAEQKAEQDKKKAEKDAAAKEE